MGLKPNQSWGFQLMMTSVAEIAREGQGEVERIQAKIAGDPAGNGSRDGRWRFDRKDADLG